MIGGAFFHWHGLSQGGSPANPRFRFQQVARPFVAVVAGVAVAFALWREELTNLISTC